MKVHRLLVTPTLEQLQARDRAQARKEVRRFAAFCDAHDPELLAADVDDVVSTLATIARIESWFKKFAAGLPNVEEKV